ncbi:MAG TPA: outer membrane lipoprotein-sorting protein [Deltaproteobacteria bacterium]|nr:outer membrane lipoprotein-sorting protein [Deltaproteobacteria bacterium]
MKNLVSLAAVLTASALMASPAAALTADEIMDRANLAYYYAGDDGKGRVTMTITDAAGRTRTRELTMLRKDMSDGGEQRYYVYFHKPLDVSGMVFMVWKHPDRDDDRWLYIPAIDLVKRVAARDKRSSFAGSNFTYEDVSGRNPSLDTHELVREETLDSRAVYVVKNTPRDDSAVEFSYYLLWIDKENFIPLRGEYYDKGGKLYKVMTVEETRTIQGILTITRARARDLEKGETVIEFKDVKYNIGIDDSIFTERFLRRPPRKYIR